MTQQNSKDISQDPEYREGQQDAFNGKLRDAIKQTDAYLRGWREGRKERSQPNRLEVLT